MDPQRPKPEGAVVKEDMGKGEGPLEVGFGLLQQCGALCIAVDGRREGERTLSEGQSPGQGGFPGGGTLRVRAGFQRRTTPVQDKDRGDSVVA